MRKRLRTLLQVSFAMMFLFSMQTLFGAPSADGITVTVDFPEPVITTIDGEHHISMIGLTSLGQVGMPVLPVKTVNVLIPYGQIVGDLEIICGEKVDLPGKYSVTPGQQMFPLSSDEEITKTKPDPAVYNSSKVYPEKVERQYDIQNKKGFSILPLTLHPVAYIPAAGKISYYRSITIKVSVGATMMRTAAPMNSLYKGSSPEVAEEIAGLISNPEQIDTYASAQPVVLRMASATVTYDYVIITSADFAAYTGANSFHALKAHKEAKGLSVNIVSTDWIYANHTGADDAEKIRNFITYAYQNWNTQYVLLGGDADGSVVGGESEAAIIPCRGFYYSQYGQMDPNIPADMYYACLDGNFDYDGDGHYGEPNDGPNGGEIDLLAEVYVGRAPIDSTTELQNFVRKTIAYETSSAAYLKSVYMIGEDLGAVPWGGDYTDEIRYGSNNWGYETKGFEDSIHQNYFTVDTLYDKTAVWPVTDVINILNGGVHIINHVGHSNNDSNMKMENADVDALTNTEYFFSYSQGCYNGAFDNRANNGLYRDYDSFTERLVVGSAGAFAAVANSRYGWLHRYTTNSPSQFFNREFWDAVLDERILELGRANQDSKEDVIGFLAYPLTRWSYFALNLLGDPETQIYAPIESKGVVVVDSVLYKEIDMVEITVADADLDVTAGADTITVTVTSLPSNDSEVITLTETGAHTKVFTGVVKLTPGTPGVGELQVAHGDEINAAYTDADDGMGNTNVHVSVHAVVDGVAPVISGVTAAIIPNEAVITWTTDESADSIIYYGKATDSLVMEYDHSDFKDHSLTLYDLDPATVYYYYVTSADKAGNMDIADNNGAYYQFKTPAWDYMRVSTMGYGRKTFPTIYNDTIVWDCGSAGAYFYDGVSVSHLGYGVVSPVTHNGEIVYTMSDGTPDQDSEIYLLDNNQAIKITDNSFNDNACVTDNGQIAWRGHDGNDYEIFFYDGTKTIRITDNTYDDDNPVLDNGCITWTADINGNYKDEIFYYDGTTVVRLTNNDTADSAPQLHNGTVVWWGYDGNDFEIYRYDGTAVTQITNNTFEDRKPHVYNGRIVWQAKDGPDYEIYYYDGGAPVKLTDNDVDDSIARVDETFITWYTGNFYPNGSSKGYVMAYDGNSITQVSDLLYNTREIDIHNGMIAVQAALLSTFDDDIFMIKSVSSKGKVFMNKELYSDNELLTVTVIDVDLDTSDQADTVTVRLANVTANTNLSIVLTETGANTQTFKGSIMLVPGIPGVDELTVASGDTLRAIYLDAEDGQGNNNVTISTDALVKTNAPSMKIEVRNTGQDPCSASTCSIALKLTNLKTQEAVDVDNLTAKMWFTTNDAINISSYWGGTIRSGSGGWIGSIAVSNVTVTSIPGYQEVTVSFSATPDLPADGGYAENMTLQLYRGAWASPFDDMCDDYSKPGSGTYHEDVHFALYENGILLSGYEPQ